MPYFWDNTSVWDLWARRCLVSQFPSMHGGDSSGGCLDTISLKWKLLQKLLLLFRIRQKGKNEFKMHYISMLESSRWPVSSLFLFPLIPWPEQGPSLGIASVCVPLFMWDQPVGHTKLHHGGSGHPQANGDARAWHRVGPPCPTDPFLRSLLPASPGKLLHSILSPEHSHGTDPLPTVTHKHTHTLLSPMACVAPKPAQKKKKKTGSRWRSDTKPHRSNDAPPPFLSHSSPISEQQRGGEGGEKWPIFQLVRWLALKKDLLHQNMPGGCASTSCHLVEGCPDLSPADTASFTSTAGGKESVFS